MRRTAYDPAIDLRTPFRALDWRWWRASRICEARDRPHPHDDDETKALVSLCRYQCVGRSRTPRQMYAGWEGIEAGIRLRDGDYLRRSEIEARILARQTDIEIAAKCGDNSEVVRWFEAIFFDVRRRLHARDVILCHATGLPGLAGYPGLTSLWKHVAYVAGVAVLEEILAASAGCVMTSDGPRWADDASSLDRERARLFISAHMLPQSISLKQLMALREHMGELEKSSARAREAQERVARIERIIPQALANLPQFTLERVEERVAV